MEGLDVASIRPRRKLFARGAGAGGGRNLYMTENDQ